jgi:hypothetical protein
MYTANMATKKAPATEAVRASFYMKADAKKKLDALASAEQRGAGLVIGAAIELYVKQLPPADKQLFDLFMKR